MIPANSCRVFIRLLRSETGGAGCSGTRLQRGSALDAAASAGAALLRKGSNKFSKLGDFLFESLDFRVRGIDCWTGLSVIRRLMMHNLVFAKIAEQQMHFLLLIPFLQQPQNLRYLCSWHS